MARYAARIRPPLVVTEVAEARGSAAEIAPPRGAPPCSPPCPPHAFAVALDLGGEAPDTEAFAARLARWLEERAAAVLPDRRRRGTRPRRCSNAPTPCCRWGA